MKTKTHNNQGSDDLDYLAELGFEAVPVAQADLNALKYRVRKLTRGPLSSRSLFYFGLGLVAGACVIYFLLPSKTSKVEDQASRNSPETATTPIVFDLDTIDVMAENFVKPRPSQQQTLATDLQTPPTNEESTDPMALEPMELKSVPAQVLEQNLKFIANAQVFYLHDLKVTNYTSLYFKNNEFLGLRGTPADRVDEEKMPHSSLKQGAQTYLHEEIASAMLLYKQGKYDRVLHLLTEIRTYNKNDLNCDFYTGMCWFQKKYFAAAIPFFDGCIEADNNTFYQEALYYKALALRETGKNEEALLLLQRVADEQGFYAKKALEILNNG